MRKSLGILVVALSISLCACGTASKKDSRFVGKWINLCSGESSYLDYITFNQDGTGQASFMQINSGREIPFTWEAVDEDQVSIETESYLNTITFSYDEQGRLTYDNNICVPEDSYSESRSALIEEMSEQGVSVDLDEFLNVSQQNSLKAEEKYKYIITTGYAYNISGNSVDLSPVLLSGSSIPSNSMIVYLKPDDLVKIEPKQQITVIGKVASSSYGCDLIHAFLVD